MIEFLANTPFHGGDHGHVPMGPLGQLMKTMAETVCGFITNIFGLFPF